MQYSYNILLLCLHLLLVDQWVGILYKLLKRLVWVYSTAHIILVLKNEQQRNFKYLSLGKTCFWLGAVVYGK